MLARDYVELKIDTDRHTNGKAVADRLRVGRDGGIPWILITDSSGKELVTSDGPGGNVGCPVTKPEVEWFMTMLRKTARNLGEEQLREVEVALKAHAKKLGG